MLTIKNFLKEEVKPALGCTEPGAIALAVARSAEELESLGIQRDQLESIRIYVSKGIFKNGATVGIPGMEPYTGNSTAAALSWICGRSSMGLEVLCGYTQKDKEKSVSLIKKNIITIHPNDYDGVYIHVESKSGGKICNVTIRGHHSNITRVECDGNLIIDRKSDTKQLVSIQEQLKEYSYSDLIKLVEDLDEEDHNFLWEGCLMNKRIADFGLQNTVGVGLGRNIRKYSSTEDLALQIKAYCAAASDARMHGVNLPVMSSAGSGNHGITAILPVYLYGINKRYDLRRITTAVAVSHLSCSMIKSHLGRLSASCGCSITAGAGAAAGITYMETENTEVCTRSIKMVLANLSGMLCDGAKFSCSFKVATGADEAYFASMLAISGHQLQPQGLVDDSIETTFSNVGRLNEEGMKPVDPTI
ncbi:MAG: L-serine ammonia-lyase, iron-sulfur-dependent, subunit alpha, partial [Spirochaetales bacterium]|nr:L-serine ammonia-lyase, iron-sulfur-dependent, subunit alpha [Spirochaetales bacterium]